jgi:hypothetical protein
VSPSRRIVAAADAANDRAYHYSRAASPSTAPTVSQLALQHQLQQCLIAAAAEGAEGAVRLFLEWGAPLPTTPLGAVVLEQHSQNIKRLRDEAAGWEGYDDGKDVGEQGVLGCLTPACLGTALVAAAGANRDVVARLLLQHRPHSALWRAAVLHPAALHAAVVEGHVQMVQLLLKEGAAQVVANNSGSINSVIGAVINNTPDGFKPALPMQDEVRVAGVKTSGSVSVQYAPPPPPFQSEAWATVLLCAAASCKSGAGPAEVITRMLLQYGLGSGDGLRCALRLVSCGKAPTWREGAAGLLLAAAFGEL